MGKAATQRERAIENIRESTLPDLKTSAKPDIATNDNPFHRSSGIQNPYQDEDTLINLQLVSKLLTHTSYPIIISGATGSGKSTFLRLFVHHYEATAGEQSDDVPECWNIIKFKAATRSKPNRLIKQICSSLDLARAASAQELYQAINDQRTAVQQRSLLIIDNAHLLTQASLELVTGLTEHCSSKIRIIMGSLPEFQSQFNLEESRIRIGVNAHILNIRPFTLEQTGDYLNRRIQAAGMTIPFTLTDVQIARIHKQSRGIPGEINQVAQLLCQSQKTSAQIARFASNTSHHPSLWQRVKMLSNSISISRVGVLPILAIFITGIAIGLFVQRDSLMQLWYSDTVSTRSPVKTETITTVPSTMESKPSIQVLPVTIRAKGSQDAPVKKQAVSSTINPVVAKLKSSKIISPDINSEIKKSVIIKSTHVASATRTKSQPVPQITADIAVHSAPDDTKINAVISKSLSSKIKRELVSKLVKSMPQTSQSSQAESPSWNLPFSQYLTGKTFQDKTWLLKQNPRNYTIQLLSAKRWKTVKQYEETHQFGSGLASYQIRFKGSDWHVLVYGKFSSRKKALERIKTFPETLRGNKFRIRKLRYVQRELKRGVILPRKKLNPANSGVETPYVEPPSVTYPNPSTLP